MKQEVLLAIIFKGVEERLKAISNSHRGPRGQRGRPGREGDSGKDFNLAEHAEILRAWAKEFALKFENLTAEQITELRGPRGRDGEDGRDFDFAEHEETIRKWATDAALKFEDLTAEQISQLRGPKGRDGLDGRHGKDGLDGAKGDPLKFEDLNAEQISALRGPRGRDGEDGKDGLDGAKGDPLKFEDLNAEQISALRGPRGRDGEDGKDFSFEESSEEISEIIRNLISEIKDSLKLKFSDLSSDDIASLRGPRGRDGKDGTNFVFDEHKDFFISLKSKFSDFTAEEKEQLMLKFSHLTDEEKDGLKLRFEDLTDEDRLKLRGARGSRGQRGQHGEKGDKGERGEVGQSIRGLPGITGVRGRVGQDGKDGRNGSDGKDAPYVVDIQVEQDKTGEFELVFHFSDGTYIRTDAVKIPKGSVFFGGGGGTGSGSGSDTTTLYQGFSGRFGEAFDTMGTEETLLQILQFTYVAPAISLAASVATSIREKGTVVASNILTATTVKKSNPITSVEFYKNGVLEFTEVAPNPDGGAEVWTDAAGFDDTATYHAIAYDGTGNTQSNTLTYAYVYPYYFGVGAPALSAANVALLTKNIIANSATVARQFSPTSQVYYFAYPAAYPALTSILDNSGFETIADWTLRTEDITGLDTNLVSYRIYEFENVTTQTAFTNTFKQ